MPPQVSKPQPRSYLYFNPVRLELDFFQAFDIFMAEWGSAKLINSVLRLYNDLISGKKTTKKVDDSLNFEEQILEAAKAIAAATSALVRVASATQRELARQGKVTSTNLDKESIWSEGLVGAARMVAAATSTLCEAANAAVQVCFLDFLFFLVLFARLLFIF